MRSLIIDLRGNPGGWLDAAVSVADRFVGEGVIVSTRGKNGIENQNYTAVRGGTWQVPLVVLIDGDSASASEIFAGAIRDHQRGTLIGATTYGKGSVQGLFHTKSFAGGVRLTVSKFYSPSGAAISDRGVTPDLSIAKIASRLPLGDSGRILAEQSVLPQMIRTAKPIGDDDASLEGRLPNDSEDLQAEQGVDVALQMAVKRAGTPHYTSQVNRN